MASSCSRISASSAEGQERAGPCLAVTGELRGRTRLDVSRTRGLTPLAGRDAELGRLVAAFSSAPGKGSGRSCCSSGEPGVGKSRLLYEFLHRLEGTGIVELEATCLSHGRSMPYHPVLELVRRYLDLSDGAADEADSSARQRARGSARGRGPRIGRAPRSLPWGRGAGGAACRSGGRAAQGPHAWRAAPDAARGQQDRPTRAGRREPSLDRRQLGGVPAPPDRGPPGSPHTPTAEHPAGSRRELVVAAAHGNHRRSRVWAPTSCGVWSAALLATKGVSPALLDTVLAPGRGESALCRGDGASAPRDRRHPGPRWRGASRHGGRRAPDEHPRPGRRAHRLARGFHPAHVAGGGGDRPRLSGHAAGPRPGDRQDRGSPPRGSCSGRPGVPRPARPRARL